MERGFILRHETKALIQENQAYFEIANFRPVRCVDHRTVQRVWDQLEYAGKAKRVWLARSGMCNKAEPKAVSTSAFSLPKITK